MLGAACAEEKKQQSKEEKKEEEEEEEQARTRDAIRQADDLYEQNKMVEALRLLERYGEEGSSNRSSRSNAEVLWRLARLCYKVGKYGTQDRAEAEQLSRAGMGFAERAVQCGDDNFACHKARGARVCVGVGVCVCVCVCVCVFVCVFVRVPLKPFSKYAKRITKISS